MRRKKKMLEWKELPKEYESTAVVAMADSEKIAYQVQKFDAGYIAVAMVKQKKGTINYMIAEHLATEEDARAAAEADYPERSKK
jgi:hypothetical protein